MVERDVVPLDERLVVTVVGDHADDLVGHVARAGTVEEVGEAVVELRHHDQHSCSTVGPLEPPGHGEPGSDVGEILAEHRGEIGVQALVCTHHVDPHEEVVLVAVTELDVVHDVAAVLEEEPADGVHDPRRLGTVEGEDVLHGRIAHGRLLSTRSR